MTAQPSSTEIFGALPTAIVSTTATPNLPPVFLNYEEMIKMGEACIDSPSFFRVVIFSKGAEYSDAKIPSCLMDGIKSVLDDQGPVYTDSEMSSIAVMNMDGWYTNNWTTRPIAEIKIPMYILHNSNGKVKDYALDMAGLDNSNYYSILINSPDGKPIPPHTPYVNNGTIYYKWGMGNSNSPYVVWGAQLRDTMNGNCQGFRCAGKDLRNYDSEVWQFLGAGEYGTKTFSFDINNNEQIDPNELFDTFNIRYGDAMGFDAISGTTPDGKTVAYGFLANGKITAPYGDGSSFPLLTLIEAENKNVPQPICGIVDPNVQGDGNFSLTEGGGALFFNFLDRGFYNSPFSTRKGYSLTSLTIISQPTSIISPDQICP